MLSRAKVPAAMQKSLFRRFSAVPAAKKAAVVGNSAANFSTVPSDKHPSPFAEAGDLYPNHPNKVNPPANVTSSPVKNTDIDQMFKNPNLKKRYVPIQLRNTGDGKGQSGEGTMFLTVSGSSSRSTELNGRI